MFFLAVSFVSVVLIAAPVVGRTGGGIIGTVVDQTSGVLPGVTVTVSGPALMGTRTEVTASDGSYRVPNLPPGEYTAVFELSAFGILKREGIRIDVGFTATVNAISRPQVNGSLTSYKDGLGGNHLLKVGGEVEQTNHNTSTTPFGPDNTILYLNNNVTTQVDVYLVPTDTRVAVRAMRTTYLFGTDRVGVRAIWQAPTRL